MENLFENFKLLIPQRIEILDIIQIVILFVALYFVLKNLRFTRSWILAKGIAVIGLIYLFFYFSNMFVLRYVVQSLFNILLIAIVIMFQPELQRFIEKIGTNNIKDLFQLLKVNKKKETYYSDDTINEIIHACEIMSENKVGALIILEKSIPLNQYSETGIKISGNVSNQLLLNIFEKNTPLHDGAVIIKNNMIEAATCYLPLSSNKGIKKSLGTRHRAGIGLSEQTDAVVVIVSEETGKISVCNNGILKENISRSKLYDYLVNNSQRKDILKAEKPKNKTPFIFEASVLFLSLFIWWAVILIEDPIEIRQINNIPVLIENSELMAEKNKAFEIIEGKNVNISVKGKRSIVSDIDVDDIVAVADFSNMSIVDSIPIEVSFNNENTQAEIKILTSSVMKVSLEDLIQAEIPLQVSTYGTTENGYQVNTITFDEKTVYVKGTKTLVNSIDKAVVNVDISNLNESGIVNSNIVVFDKNGNEVKENIELSFESVEAYVEVFEVKELPVIIEMDNKNYEIVSYEVPDVKVVYDENLIKIKNIKVTLQTEYLDDENKTIMINLPTYLPEGVSLASGQEEVIEANIDFNVKGK